MLLPLSKEMLMREKILENQLKHLTYFKSNKEGLHEHLEKTKNKCDISKKKKIHIPINYYK